MTSMSPPMRMAIRALRANSVRSGLTILGVVIGVAAVIATVAVGSGARDRIQKQIASIGSNLIVVIPGSLTTSGIRLGSGNALTLTEDDARAIAAECPSVALAAPVVRQAQQVVAGVSNWATGIVGTTPDFLSVRDLGVARGAPFTSQDVDGAANVALLGETVVRNLFPAGDAVGQSVRVRNVTFTVVGVLAPKGQSPSGQDQDDVILIPISTAKKKVLGSSLASAGAVGSIMTQARSAALIRTAQDEMRALLRQRHHLQPTEEDDFTIRNLEDVFNAQEASARVMAMLLAAIASVSLVVGGIGIMNVMLVSVTERTREIGLRLAVGARTRDILLQFLAEAVVLASAGGMLGVITGLAGAIVISRIAGWSIVLSGPAILLAFFFSGMVGVFFGYYPAQKAALLDPIEALHYE